MDIREFYEGQTIFLTGSTGFVGKAITEKLLRTCPNIGHLYILVRSKKGKNATQRVQELFNDPVFSRMKTENAEYMSKVTGIPGDVSLPGLGISEENRQKLVDTVTVVFHGAATVKFDEKLKVAVNINVFGTKQMTDICKQCRNLKVMVHISTAYSNCNTKDVKETLYPSQIGGEEMINIAKSIPDEILEKCTPMILSDWPNTYTFTKQIAEDVIRKEASDGNLPVVVFRPAIVVGSAEEPIPGWVDNVYGPNGIMAAVGAGLMRTIYADTSTRAELVPVDMVVNAILAVGWEVASNNSKPKDSTEYEVPTYNYASSDRNPLTWGDFMYISLEHGRSMPTKRAVWYYTVFVTCCLPLFYLQALLVHFLPAFAIDAVLIAAAQKPQAVKIYKKMHKFLNVISFFSNNQWKFYDDNITRLWKKVSEEERELFNFNNGSIDWNHFLYNNIIGMRVFLMQDTPDTLPAARKKMFLLHILHRFVQLVFFSFLVWLFWSPALFLFNWLASTGAAIVDYPDDPSRNTLASVVKSARPLAVK